MLFSIQIYKFEVRDVQSWLPENNICLKAFFIKVRKRSCWDTRGTRSFQNGRFAELPFERFLLLAIVRLALRARAILVKFWNITRGIYR